jgi:hypothetical protein
VDGGNFMAVQRRRRTTTQRQAKGHFIDPETKRLLKREAKGLGLKSDEYLRLVGQLSATLRRGLADGEPVDARKLVKWAENPLVLSMIQMVCQYAVKSLDSSGEESSEKPNEASSEHNHSSDAASGIARVPEPSTNLSPAQPNVARPTPQPYVDPWYGPMPGPPQADQPRIRDEPGQTFYY